MTTASHADHVRRVTARLAAAGVPSPEVDARWIVEDVADRFGGRIDGCHVHVLDGLVDRRVRREPLQLVLGHAAFRHVEVRCRPGVFVPRPETEVVAGRAIEAARAVDGPATVVETCTGTGAIALAVASEVPRARVVAADVDPDAVALARDNAARLLAAAAPTPWRPGDWSAPHATLEVVEGPLLDAVPVGLRGRVDVLVANPPYLPASDRGTWQPEVGDHDPDRALVGGDDGHEVVDALLDLASTWLRPGGTVVVEIDDRRGADALAAATAAGLVAANLLDDLTGRARAVVANRRTAPTP